MIVSVFDPGLFENGATRRVKQLLTSFNTTELHVLSFFKRGCISYTWGNVTYHPIKLLDLFSVFYCLCQGWPISTAIYQRRSIKNIANSEKAIYHLIRSVQWCYRDRLLYLDVCESLSYNLEARSERSNSIFKRILYKFELLRLRKLEYKLSDSVENAYFISSSDRLFSIYQRSKVLVNKASLALFANKAYLERDFNKIGFIGDLSYFPNIESLTRISDCIANSNLKCVVVGGGAKRELTRKCKSLEFVGYVNDPTEYLANCCAGVFLSDASTGLQNKILDYLSLGLPVITNKPIASAFIAPHPFLVVESDFEIFEHIESLRDRTFFEKKVEDGFEYLEYNYR